MLQTLRQWRELTIAFRFGDSYLVLWRPKTSPTNSCSRALTMLSSNRTSRAASASNARSMRESEITLTAVTDGASDYQQYLEKTSNPRASSLLASPPPTASAPTMSRNHSVRASRPTTAITESQEVSQNGLAFEPIRSEKRRKKKKTHRVERAEDPHEYPGPLALAILTFGICLSVFLVSLDRTIVATVSLLGSLD